jgi:citrate lyase beta subunit
MLYLPRNNPNMLLRAPIAPDGLILDLEDACRGPGKRRSLEPGRDVQKRGSSAPANHRPEQRLDTEYWRKDLETQARWRLNGVRAPKVDERRHGAAPGRSAQRDRGESRIEVGRRKFSACTKREGDLNTYHIATASPREARSSLEAILNRGPSLTGPQRTRTRRNPQSVIVSARGGPRRCAGHRVPPNHRRRGDSGRNRVHQAAWI